MRSPVFVLILSVLVLSSFGCERDRAASISRSLPASDGPMVAQQNPVPSATPGDACDVPERQLFIGTLPPGDGRKDYSPYDIHIWGDDAWHVYDSVLATTPETTFDLGKNVEGWDGAVKKTNGTLQCVKLIMDPVKNPNPKNDNKTNVFCDIDLNAYHNKLPDIKSGN